MVKKVVELDPGKYAISAGKQFTYNIASEIYADALAEQICKSYGYNNVVVTVYKQSFGKTSEGENDIIFNPYYTLTMVHTMQKEILV